MTEQDNSEERMAKIAVTVFGTQLTMLLAEGNWRIAIVICDALRNSIRALDLIEIQRKQELNDNPQP